MSTTMEAIDESQPEVLLKQKPQNPIKVLELFVKGFCPVIQDRVDVNDHGSASSRSETDTTRSESEKLSVSTAQRKQAQHNRPTIRDDEPFEIAERPPSNVIGISKKMWEEFCSNPALYHPSKACKGFCNNHLTRFRDDIPPEGEECSIGTTTSTSSIDLSPQSTPRGLSLQHELSLNDSFLDDEEEDLYLPVAEYKNQRSYRATHVFIMTIVAVYITLVVLRSMGPVGVNFALESKSSSSHGPFVFSINYR